MVGHWIPYPLGKDCGNSIQTALRTVYPQWQGQEVPPKTLKLFPDKAFGSLTHADPTEFSQKLILKGLRFVFVKLQIQLYSILILLCLRTENTVQLWQRLNSFQIFPPLLFTSRILVAASANSVTWLINWTRPFFCRANSLIQYYWDIIKNL